MTAQRYAVYFTPQATKMLAEIKDGRVRGLLTKRAMGLTREPDKQGKPMVEELQGFRSIRAVGQRYRIIYAIREARVIVTVVAVGLRKQGSKKDVYELARRLARLGLLEPPE